MGVFVPTLAGKIAAVVCMNDFIAVFAVPTDC